MHRPRFASAVLFALILSLLSHGAVARAAEGDNARRVADAVVSVVFANGMGTWRGSGFCIGNGSWVVTCRHVVTLDVGRGKRLEARQASVLSPWVGEAMAADVVAVDEAADLALLRLERPGLPALPLADEAERDRLQPVGEGDGARLAIAGFPQPTEGDTAAVVTSQQREGTLIGRRTEGEVRYLVLAPTPDVGKGWSGGPLYQPESGKVVGVFHALIARASEPGTWFPQSISAARIEALLQRAGVTDLAPFRAPPAPAIPRAPDAETLFRHEYRASALSVTRRWAAVEVERRALVKLRPESARAHNALAVALEEQDKHEEALAAFNESLRLDPRRARTHINKGLALQGMGRLPEAEEAIRKAIELAADDAEAWIALGRVLAVQKRRDEAEAAMRKAVELSPNHPLARWNHGMSLVQMEKVEEGVAELREAAALGANFPPLRMMRLNLAQVLQATGRHDEAEAEYRSLLQNADDNPAAHLFFAGFLRSRGKNDEALVHARRCLELKPPAQLEAAAQSLVKALGGARD